VAQDRNPPEPTTQEEKEEIFLGERMTCTATHVVSLRLPSETVAALERSAADARLSVAGTLDWFLRYSVENFELLRGLADCPDRPDAKLDARVPGSTFDSLRAAASQLKVSPSVYIRRLLFHFYVTKRLKYVQSRGHYTLAYRHD
jgi:hypothetical protein